jgi:hypothetical protein
MPQSNRTRLLIRAVTLLFLGLIGVVGLGEPALDRYRPVDVLRMLAAGACFGIAILTIVSYLRGAREGGA